MVKLLVALTLGLGIGAVQAPSDLVDPKCCKICRKGKACGDSCISKDKTCHKGKGCACNG